MPNASTRQSASIRSAVGTAVVSRNSSASRTLNGTPAAVMPRQSRSTIRMAKPGTRHNKRKPCDTSSTIARIASESSTAFAAEVAKIDQFLTAMLYAKTSPWTSTCSRRGYTAQPSRGQKPHRRDGRGSSLGAHASSVLTASNSPHAGCVRSQENAQKSFAKSRGHIPPMKNI